MKNPFISIVIPTHNRKIMLEKTIKAILRQSFDDFEIIISDNASTDNTQASIKNFKDKRMHYIRNKTNIGWINNLKNGIKHAKGKYILLHGDDDHFISSNSLADIHQIVKGKNYGYIRTNFLSMRKGKVIEFKKKYNNNYIIKPDEGNYKTILHIQETDPYFISGIIFLNSYTKKYKIIDSEAAPWFDFIFNATKEKGALYIAQPMFICRWEEKLNHPFYVLHNEKFRFENYFKTVKNLENKIDYQKFLKTELDKCVITLPLNKYSTSTRNMLLCARRILELYPSYIFSPKFIVILVISIFAPKPIIYFAREYAIGIQFSEVKNFKYENL